MISLYGSETFESLSIGQQNSTSPRTLLYLTVAALGCVFSIRKSFDLRRNWRDHALWLVILSTMAGAMGYTFAAEPIYRSFDRWTGVPNSSTVLVYTSAITVYCPTTLAVLLLWRLPRRQAWRVIRPILASFGAILIVQVALFFAADVPVEHPWDFDIVYGPDLTVGSFLLVSYLPLLVVLAAAVAATRRYSKVLGTTFSRRAVRTLSVGFFIMTGFPSNKIAYVLLAWAGARLVWLNHIAIVCAFAGAALLIFGISHTSPNDVAYRCIVWIGHWRTYRRLHPLWKAVTDRHPQVVLGEPAWRPLANLPIRHVKFRLFRRYVEIRDALRALRPYEDAADDASARSTVARLGLTGESAAVLAEALRIHTALRHCDSGTYAPNEPISQPVGGDDLPSELTWLIKVSRAFAELPGSPMDRSTQEVG